MTFWPSALDLRQLPRQARRRRARGLAAAPGVELRGQLQQLAQGPGGTMGSGSTVEKPWFSYGKMEVPPWLTWFSYGKMMKNGDFTMVFIVFNTGE